MLSSLLRHKYLIRELVSRDIRSRYVGSVAGLFWSILNPALQLALYTLVFSLVLEIRFGPEGSTGNFALNLFAVLLPWMAIQEGVVRSARTFIENANIIKKQRFPLEALPFSILISSVVHQLLGTVVFLLVLAVAQLTDFRFLVLVFPLFGIQILMTYGLAAMAASLNVFFRDVAQLLGALFMAFFWVTPIVYPRSRAPEPYQFLLSLNPLTHMVEAYRFAFLGAPEPSFWGLLYWGVLSLGFYRLGRFVLDRTRNQLVDLL
jgi:ABC-type polysaccharide/polyol phosphate export permease